MGLEATLRCVVKAETPHKETNLSSLFKPTEPTHLPDNMQQMDAARIYQRRWNDASGRMFCALLLCTVCGTLCSF